MFRSLLRSAMFAATALIATPAMAQTTPFYVALPATAPAHATLMIRDTIWHSDGTAYVTQQQNERAAILCELLARQVGPLTSFSAGGRAFDAARLARCNGASH